MRAIAAFVLAMAAWLGACGATAGDRAAQTGGDGTVARPSLDGGSSISTSHELRVAVDGIRSSSGTVLIGLYDSAESFERAIELSDKEGFLNDPSRVAGAALKANAAKTAGVVFLNLPPGRYGVIVFQDENGNGRLDKNFWGVPTEPYGFSNNAQGALGPPAFADVVMTLDGDGTVDIALVYHGGGHAGVRGEDTDVAYPLSSEH